MYLHVIYNTYLYLSVDQAVTRSPREREILGSNLGPVKSNTMLPTTRHRCDIFSKEVVLPTGATTRKWALQTRYTLRHNTASMMKDLVFIDIIEIDNIRRIFQPNGSLYTAGGVVPGHAEFLFKMN